MTNFDRDILNAARNNAKCGKEHRVTIAGDHLGRNRLRREAHHFADMLFNGGVDVGESSNRA